MGIPERKEREKEQRRNDIVDAAERVFFSKGIWTATMDDVAEAAELSKGTLYLYFKNKEELYYAINLRSLKILVRLFQEAVEQGKTGFDQVFLIGRAFYRFSQEYSQYFNILTYYEIKDVDFTDQESVARQCDMHGQDAIDLLIGAIRTGIQDGSIRPELDPARTAVMLWGLTSGIIQLVALKGGHLQARHGVRMDSLVDETFSVMKCMLENKRPD